MGADGFIREAAINSTTLQATENLLLKANLSTKESGEPVNFMVGENSSY